MKRLFFVIMVMLTAFTVNAQDGGFNPANPPEPLLRHQLTVTTQPSGAGSAQGGGLYAEGTNVTVSTNGNTGYTFQYWMLDGVPIEATQRFTYVMTNKPATLVAVYEYKFEPNSPSEPVSIPLTYRLYLQSEPSGAGYFNRNSGEAARPEYGVYLVAKPNNNYVFKGWYDEKGSLLSNDAAFTYTMPYAHTTLTARFNYYPNNPNEPIGNQDSVENTAVSGDVNGDGNVDVADIANVIDCMSGNSAVNKTAADVNKDGTVDVADIATIIDEMAARARGLKIED